MIGTRIISLFLLICVIGQAQPAGRLLGVITDDIKGNPLPGANVIVVGTDLGTVADINGFYDIRNVPAGRYTLRIEYMEYLARELKDVSITSGSMTELNIKLTSDENAKQEEQPVGQANSPNDNAAPAPDRPVADGRARVGMNTPEFTDPGLRPRVSPLLDLEGPSYRQVRNALLSGRMPWPGQVQLNEMINYFGYEFAAFDRDDPVSLCLEYSECPWNSEHALLRVGLHGRDDSPFKYGAADLSLLIDLPASGPDFSGW